MRKTVANDKLKKIVPSKAIKVFKRTFYVLEWLPKYRKNDIVADMIAGITVGLTMMPQSIAYASLAELPTQFGLYTALMGSFIYIFFGTIKQISIGPSSLMTILTFSYTGHLPIEYMVLLCFLSGCVELLMGILNLGFLVDFISAPVTSGFTSATSLIIILAQLKNLFGIKFSSNGIFDLIKKLILHATELKLGDTLLGFVSIIFLLCFRHLGHLKVSNKKMQKFCWLLSISRNALVVLICSFAAFLFDKHTGEVPFRITGTVEPGFPAFKMPSFSIRNDTETTTTTTFTEMIGNLGSSIVVVPFVAVLANVAIAKSFASGTIVDASQEMIALGFCNIFGSFVQALPTTGAFSRSAVNNASGVRTPLNGLYAGIIILLAFFLTPYFYFIPKATLAAVLISAVIFMVDVKIIPILWKCSKLDCLLICVTLGGSLIVGVEQGLLVGVGINMILLLKHWSRPTIETKLHHDDDKNEYTIIKPDLGLYFPAVDYLTQKIVKLTLDKETPVVIDFTHVLDVDYTAAEGLRNLIELFNKKPNELIYLNMKDCVKAKLATLVPEEDIPLCDSLKKLPAFLNKFKRVQEVEDTSPLIIDVEETLEVPRKLSCYETA